MRLILLIIFTVIIYYLIIHISNTNKNKNYLIEIGIPVSTIMRMSSREIEASAQYLQRYAKTGLHFTVDDPDYQLLSNIRLKYGIFQ